MSNLPSGPNRHIALIDQHGLQDEVKRLFCDQNLPATAIHKILNSQHGLKISLSSVRHYIAKRYREKPEKPAEIPTPRMVPEGSILLPQDLEALEVIEADSLNNAKPETQFKSHLPGIRREFIDYWNEEWSERAAAAAHDPDQMAKFASVVLKQCFSWIGEHLKFMKEKRDERKVALKAIEMKLNYQAQLKGKGKGNIMIVRNDSGRPQHGQPADVPHETTAKSGKNTLRIIRRNP